MQCTQVWTGPAEQAQHIARGLVQHGIDAVAYVAAWAESDTYTVYVPDEQAEEARELVALAERFAAMYGKAGV